MRFNNNAKVNLSRCNDFSFNVNFLLMFWIKSSLDFGSLFSLEGLAYLDLPPSIH